MSYNFSHTLLSNLDCIKKANYYLDKTPGINSFAANAGIDLHTVCEEYLKTLREPEGLKPEQYVKFLKIKPYLDEIVNFLLSVESKVNREHDRLGPCVAKVDAVVDNNEGLWVVDWKFPDKPWDNRKFEWYKLHQALLYIWVFEFEYHKAPDGLIFKVVPTLGGVQTFTVPWNDAEIERAFNFYVSKKLTLDTYRSMGKAPVTPSYLCNWCSWKEICPERYVRKNG